MIFRRNLPQKTFYKNFSSIAEAFEIISRKRTANNVFIDKPVEPKKLRKVLELMQLAPSSFNIQPFQIIVITDTNAKLDLVEAMIGGNSKVVKNASHSFIFLSYKGNYLFILFYYFKKIYLIILEPTVLTNKLMKLEQENGKSSSYVSSLPSKVSFLLGSGIISNKLKKLGTHLFSPLSPTPVINDDHISWSFKNTSFAAQQLMLACSAYDISSTPMEGFDERRVKAIFKIPHDKFSIPYIISIGYTKNSEDVSIPNIECDYPPKVRYPLDEICFENIYGQKPITF